MTYLELVNGVLRRLREDEVTSVTANPYTKLIGDFVNDAKALVEKAWDWTHLREKLVVATVEGVTEYTWDGDGNPVEVISSWNDTSNGRLNYNSQTAFDKRLYTYPFDNGEPREFTFRSIDSNGDTVIEVYPTPDGVYSLVFNAKVEQGALTENGDRLLVPWEPVLHMALAFGARERGETGGTSTQEYFALADTYLRDAIALDANMHPEETTFDAGYRWPNNTLRL